MEPLLELCRALSSSPLLGATLLRGGCERLRKPPRRKSNSTVGDGGCNGPARAARRRENNNDAVSGGGGGNGSFGTLLWTIFRCVRNVVRDDADREGGNGCGGGGRLDDNGDDYVPPGYNCGAKPYRRWQSRSIRDFFTLSVDRFIGRYYAELDALPLADRRLVLAVKFRLTFTLESGNNSYGFARCLYTIARFVPSSTATTLAGKASAAFRDDDCGLLNDVGARGNVADNDPYAAPDPYALVRESSRGLDRSSSDQQQHDPAAVDINGVFRRQRVLVGFQCGGKRSTRGHWTKFRTQDLPAGLRDDTGQLCRRPRNRRRFDSDLETLMTRFTVNWAKLHYLEPCVFPQHGDR